MKVMIPASYDPITNAHINLVERASMFASKVYLCIAINPGKKCLFDIEERKQILQEVFKNSEKVEVVINEEGLTIEKAKQLGVKMLVRGLRVVADFEQEIVLAQANRTQVKEVETVLLMTDPAYSFISSTMVKQLASVGGNLSEFVPKIVADKLREKYNVK